jgi:hypothetical protein
MDRPTSLLDILDGRPHVKASRLRVGPVRARGVPSILIGVAAIVFAAGVGQALQLAARALPETIRETRDLMLVARGAQRELPPA